MEAFNKTKKQLLDEYQVNQKQGLTSEQVAKRQEEYGPNQLRESKKKTLLMMFLDQFKDFLVIILIIAAAVSVVVGIIEGEGLIDGIIIIAIVLLNAILGVNQEQKANNALAALKKMSSPNAKVIRDGKTIEIPSHELTMGDIVLLETGDYVAADIRLLESTNLKTDEASLTGESTPVEKDASIELDESTPLAERENSVYMSTLVTYGKGKGLVSAIGMDTEIGKIATMLDAVEEGKTPLQKTIDQFAKVLGVIIIIVSVVVFLLGFVQNSFEFELELFLTSVALAVAAIPEGLTAVITVVLALGMQRMVKRNAIIKNLSTVETLGQATVICSDKTGTLTQNEMTVRRVYDLDNVYEITGNGYETKGDILLNNQAVDLSHNLEKIMQISLLCNDSKIESANKILGDPTEGALLVLAAKAGMSVDNPEDKYPQLNEYTFDSTRKMMTSINEVEGKNLVLTKGATDQLIKKCNRISIKGEVREITSKDIDNILKQNEEFSGQAYRVLGFAYRETDTPKSMDLEEDLIFVGMVAMIDPPRVEAKEAIAKCHKAGIRVMMITGDHITTAKAIASELNILKEGGLALSGEDTRNMSDEEFEEAILKCDVFARSTPADKIRIVEVLQKNGQVVAMTGDGVNDSPALKQAEIGVAMGITGTEVSKEASNMILTDDNFASIVSAVEEGRTIYSNIRKFTIFLVSCNIGEILLILVAMIFAPFFNDYLPLLAIHLLWINLMTDSFPAFALGMEKAEGNTMDKAPRDTNEKLLNKETLIKVSIQGFGLMLAGLAAFKIGLTIDGRFQATTMAFIAVVFGELLRAFSARSETKFLFQYNPFSNKFLNYSVFISLGLVLLLVYIPFTADIFNLEPLTIGELLIAMSLGIVPMLFGELTKVVQKGNY
ncbi:calcium-translocating P-type ATPase, PMCA-type [Hujiaoplasma nucleasis]|uniref:P-type Ca(2+) transporter n=1 Tax=Hujiaoplasma nucleasis TaxID=2725268 RepID=A0A7L6N559_9MOLU|nr:calcium-translocating P-type ATPase, PMCA-type [Hujiaoplasma nucleasis]QLY40378.1 calcium-translocating P-type ATPase, PMCA-type [Hujiaoplasma nucleasis]